MKVIRVTGLPRRQGLPDSRIASWLTEMLKKSGVQGVPHGNELKTKKHK